MAGVGIDLAGVASAVVYTLMDIATRSVPLILCQKPANMRVFMMQ